MQQNFRHNRTWFDHNLQYPLLCATSAYTKQLHRENDKLCSNSRIQLHDNGLILLVVNKFSVENQEIVNDLVSPPDVS